MRPHLRRHGRVRLDADDGYSLMELLVVLLLVGVLVAVGGSVYLGMRDDSQVTAAELNVREALGAVHTFHADRETYNGMSIAELRGIDAGIRLSREPVISGDGLRYCIESTHNGRSPGAPTSPGRNIHSSQGPGGDIVSSPCPASI